MKTTTSKKSLKTRAEKIWKSSNNEENFFISKSAWKKSLLYFFTNAEMQFFS